MNLEVLATKAAHVMMRGAVQFLRSKGIASESVDLDALVVELRSRSAPALDVALRDAKDALAAGMDRVAEATFVSTMALAGMEAAKAVVR